MTDVATSPGLLGARTTVFNPGDAPNAIVARGMHVRARVITGVAALSRLLRITIQPAVAVPDGQGWSVLAVDTALADAVRRQLTKPGSIPPQQQLQLIMADRAVHDSTGSAVTPVSASGWTPFRPNVETRPYRPIAEMGCALSDQTDAEGDVRHLLGSG